MMNKISLWTPLSPVKPKEVSKTVSSFLDTAATSFGRATHYKSKKEMQDAEIRVHDRMIGLDRDLYAMFLMLPGVTDRSKQLGLRNLLSIPRKRQNFLTDEQETKILHKLLRGLPPQRAFKIIDSFRVTNIDAGIVKANNARTRKLILRTVLKSKKLDFWAVKYRQKICRALTHAWGKRKTSIIKSILAKPTYDFTEKEFKILNSAINKYYFYPLDRIGLRRQLVAIRQAGLYECVSFILGNKNNLTRPLLVAYEAAKENLSDGSILPPEVLEGIRSTYHPNDSKEEVIRLATKSKSMTAGQKMTMQKRAEKAGAILEFNPENYKANKLYTYAFERGMTKDIETTLKRKAYKAAESFPMEYNNVGIVVDASKSMMGEKEQRLKPISDALALRDMLQRTGRKYTTTYTGGGLLKERDDRMVFPMGDTSLSEAFLKLFTEPEQPDAVFVISDGFENRPSGRFSEVMKAVRDVGVSTPVYHLNPVLAGEEGVKSLSSYVTTMPLQSPEGLGLTIVRALVDEDPYKAINSLLSMVSRRALS